MTKIPTKTSAEQISHLHQKLMDAQIRFDLWEGFQEALESFDNVEVINAYPQFFVSTSNSLFESSVIKLYSIYETRSDSINVPRSLLAALESERVVCETQRATYRASIALIKAIWIKLGVLRNELYAHQSVNSDAFSSLEKANVSRSEIRELIDRSKQLLCTIASDSGGGKLMFNLEPKSSLVALLADLSLHRQRSFRDGTLSY
jgi:AbiU2